MPRASSNKKGITLRFKTLLAFLTILATALASALVVASPAQASRGSNFFNVSDGHYIHVGDTLRMRGQVGDGKVGGRVTLQLKASGNASSGNWMTMKVFSVGADGKFAVTKTAVVTGTWRVSFRRYATFPRTDKVSETDYVRVLRHNDLDTCHQLVEWDEPVNGSLCPA